MQAQTSLEFLVDAAIVLAMIGVLLATLQALADDAQRHREEYEQAVRLEQEARALDGLSNSFAHGYIEATAYRVDQHRIRQNDNGEWMEAKTLYDDGQRKEPV